MLHNCCVHSETHVLGWAQVKGIVVGEGFRFGYKAQGDTAMLTQLCRQHDLGLIVAPLLGSSADSGSASSSKVWIPSWTLSCRQIVMQDAHSMSMHSR